MRATSSTTASDALDLADETLQLIDTLRGELSALEQHRASLQLEIGGRERESQALLHAMPFAIVVTDARGCIVDANRAAALLLGRSIPRLKEELLLHFFDDRAAFSELLQSLASAGMGERTVLKLRPRERAPFDAEISIVRDPRQGAEHWLWFVGRSNDRQTSRRTIVVPSAARSTHHQDVQ